MFNLQLGKALNRCLLPRHFPSQRPLRCQARHLSGLVAAKPSAESSDHATSTPIDATSPPLAEPSSLVAPTSPPPRTTLEEEKTLTGHFESSSDPTKLVNRHDKSETTSRNKQAELREEILVDSEKGYDGSERPEETSKGDGWSEDVGAKVLDEIHKKRIALSNLTEDFEKALDVDPSTVVETELEYDEPERQRNDPSTVFGKKYIGQVDLPEDLKTAVNSLLKDVSSKDMVKHTKQLTSHLRATALPVVLKKKYLSKESKPRENPEEGEKDDEISRVPSVGKYVLTKKNTPHLYWDYEHRRKSAAYVAARMPTTYAATFNVLNELSRRFPEWAPRHVVDYGTGPGTAIWAAREVWGDRINKFVGIDSSNVMLKIAEELLNSLPEESRPPVAFNDMMRFGKMKDVDLVISAFALEHETSILKQHEKILNLWAQTKEVLVLIERATPAGFQTIARARDFLLRENKHIVGSEDEAKCFASVEAGSGKQPERGAHVVAPCPHDGVCPIFRGGTNICGFSQRLGQPTYMRDAKEISGKANNEDTKYCYVILRRGLRPAPKPRASTSNETTFVLDALRWPRIVLPPIKRDKHVLLDVCCEDGDIRRKAVTRSKGRDAYRAARKSNWGDLFPLQPKKEGGVRDMSKRMYKAHMYGPEQ